MGRRVGVLGVTGRGPLHGHRRLLAALYLKLARAFSLVSWISKSLLSLVITKTW
jgi:hypothetical protein